MNKKFIFLTIFISSFNIKIIGMQHQYENQSTQTNFYCPLILPEQTVNSLFKTAETFLKSCEEEKAFEIFSILAESPNYYPPALFHVALMMSKGIGCEKNICKAYETCLLAVKLNYQPAIQILEILKLELNKYLIKQSQKEIVIDLGSILKAIKSGNKQETFFSEDDNSSEDEEYNPNTNQPPDGLYL